MKLVYQDHHDEDYDPERAAEELAEVADLLNDEVKEGLRDPETLARITPAWEKS